MTGAVGKRPAWRRAVNQLAIDRTPLRTPAFRRLWIGNCASHFGFQLTSVAVPVEMFALTRSSYWVGLLGLAALVPLVIFALWGGAVADAVDRRRLLLYSSVLTWLATLGLLLQGVLRVGSPGLLLVLVAVQSMAFAISSPTRNSILPRLLPIDEVAAANTLNFTASSGAAVFGPLAAGAIFAVTSVESGVPVAYALDALLFTITLWATIRLPALPPPENGVVGVRAAGLRSVVAGLRYLATTPVLVLTFVIDILAMALAMPRALFPEVAESQFGGGAAVGWLYSAIAIGSVLGGLSSGWIGRIRRQGLALIAAVVAWGLAVAAAGLAGQLWLMVALLALGGSADLVSAVFRQTILLIYAPDEMRGRVQGVFTMVVAGGPRLGDMRAGMTAALFGPTIAWVGGGVAAAVLAVGLGLLFPALRRYSTDDPVQPVSR